MRGVYHADKNVVRRSVLACTTRAAMATTSGSGTSGARLATIAARHPANIAVVEGDATITFARLDVAATSIAARICATGNGQPGCVCLFFENKLPAIEAI